MSKSKILFPRSSCPDVKKERKGADTSPPEKINKSSGHVPCLRVAAPNIVYLLLQTGQVLVGKPINLPFILSPFDLGWLVQKP